MLFIVSDGGGRQRRVADGGRMMVPAGGRAGRYLGLLTGTDSTRAALTRPHTAAPARGPRVCVCDALTFRYSITCLPATPPPSLILLLAGISVELLPCSLARRARLLTSSSSTSLQAPGASSRHSRLTSSACSIVGTFPVLYGRACVRLEGWLSNGWAGCSAPPVPYMSRKGTDLYTESTTVLPV